MQVPDTTPSWPRDATARASRQSDTAIPIPPWMISGSFHTGSAISVISSPFTARNSAGLAECRGLLSVSGNLATGSGKCPFLTVRAPSHPGVTCPGRHAAFQWTGGLQQESSRPSDRLDEPVQILLKYSHM